VTTGYGNLNIAANTKAAVTSFDVKGSLSVGASTNFYYDTHTITVNGGVSNGGVINGAAGDPLTGKVVITGGSAVHNLTSTAANATYGNLEIADNTYIVDFTATAGNVISGDLT